MVVAEPISVAEFERRLGEFDGVELIDGVPHMRSTAWESAVIAQSIGSCMLMYVQPRRLGGVVGANCHFVLDRQCGIVQLPRAAFVRTGRVPTGPERDKAFQGAPDLAVEVRSPFDDHDELRAQMRQYLAYGTRLGWLVDPCDRTASVWRPDEEPALLGVNDTLDGEDVLPGFTLPVAWLFDRAAPLPTFT